MGNIMELDELKATWQSLDRRLAQHNQINFHLLREGKLDKLNRALLLLYLEDHSYREIAEILGISETNVATKISRLKQRIRNEI